MALVVVATFMSLTEAQIAAGALRAGGLHPEVADQHFGSVMWTDQVAIQGFRLTVPEDEAADARAYLAEVAAQPIPPPIDRPDRPAPGGGFVWRALAVLLSLTLSPLFGWLAVAGLRGRRYGHASLAMALVGAAAAAALVIALVVQIWPVARPVLGLALAGAVIAGVGRLMRAATESEDAGEAPDE